MDKRKKNKKIRKRKVKLSREYVEHENEVQKLLQTHKETTVQNICNNTDKSIEFFTESFKNLDIANKNIESEHETISTTQRSEVAVAQLASSYVKIDEATFIQPSNVLTVNFDRNLLYLPSYKRDIYSNNDATLQKFTLPENDGFYNEIKYTNSDNNYNLMINRFREDNSNELILHDQILSKMNNIGRNDFLYKTDSKKIIIPLFVPGKHANYIQTNTKEKNEFIISIDQLHFNEHYLFKDEHKIAIKLQNFYSIYKNNNEQNTLTKIESELLAVREIYNNILIATEVDDVKNPEELDRYIFKIKQLRNLLHEEEKNFRVLITDILTTWKQLKDIRNKSGENLTNLKLIIKTIEPVDYDIEETAYNHRFEMELKEIIQESMSDYYKQKRIRKSYKKENKSSPKIPNPKPNIDEIRLELRKLFLNSVRPPNEPKLTIEMVSENSENETFNKSKKYFIKLYLDNQLVGSTKKYVLNSNFSISISESFAILLKERIPNNIKIEIYEKSNLIPELKIIDLVLPFSKAQTNYTTNADVLQFSNEKFKISGFLKIILKFQNLLDQFKINNINKSIENLQIDNKNPQYLCKRTTFNNIDKNSIFECKTEFADNIQNNIDNYNYFNLNELSYTFCSKEFLNNNLRLNMLKDRFNSIGQYRNFTLIPAFDRELEEKHDMRIIDDSDVTDCIHFQRHRGKKYIQELYEKILTFCEKLNKNQSSLNLLIGDEALTFSSILESLSDIFGPKRPLNPQKKSVTSRICMDSNTFQNFNIIVNVVRATGIPIRNTISTLKGSPNSSASQNRSTLKYANVRPYITVSYNDKSSRTLSADGSNPTWNEQLILQVSGKAIEMKGDVKFQVFDEYIEDLINDEHIQITEVYQRIYSKWLGELRIPISTIFNMQKIEGTFILHMPKMLLDYGRPTLDTNADSRIHIEDIPEIKDVVYLSLFITLEPQFELLTATTNCLDCSELKEVKDHILNWCNDVHENFPDRYIDPMASLWNGKRVCLTRLLESIPIPFEINKDTEYIIRRYVSLIPVLHSVSCLNGLNGIWLSNQIILDTCWASPKDLGVLLACFYLTLGIQVFLALAIGYPYGEMTFVILKRDSTYTVIDPASGNKYSIRDIFCPMVKVLAIVDQSNIFLNIQKETRVSLMNFNFNDSRCWLAIFNKYNPAPVGGVHELTYKYAPPQSINELRKTIERKIMKKINSWRSNRRTIWNRSLYDIMYKLLEKFELDAVYNRNEVNYNMEISKKCTAYKVSGFTINMCFTNLSSISDRIKSTGFHLNSDVKAEFSTAVYLKQYPNNIISVWIFLVSLIPYH